jgi:hypothetical protein
LVIVLALTASGLGLFWQDGSHPSSVTTARGRTFELYGQGVYRYDSLQAGATSRGTDAVTFFICIPLLILALLLYRRGALRGGVLLTGMLGYFLCNSASLAFGAAYNSLYLVYVAYFSASLFAFGIAFTSIDLQAPAARLSDRLPRQGIVVFLVAAGLLLMLIWMSDIVGALLSGRPPAARLSNTTVVTYVLDLAITAPGTLLAALYLVRRVPAGYLLAAILLSINAIVGLVVVAQTVANRLAGVSLSLGQFIAFVVSFILLSLITSWLAILVLRTLSHSTMAPGAHN